MDFSAHRTEHTAAVPLDWDFAVRVVLRGGTGDDRELEIDAVDGRAIHTDAIIPHHSNNAPAWKYIRFSYSPLTIAWP
jgi:hypothetical protein